jgi:hypothetical protein
MSTKLTPPAGYIPPNAYIGEEYEQPQANTSADVRVVTLVGRGSRLVRQTNQAIVRGYVYNAPLDFTKTAPHFAVLTPASNGNNKQAVIVDADGAEVRSDLWLFSEDNASVQIADSAFDPTRSYFISYQSNSRDIADPIPMSDIRVIEGIGSQISQDSYKRNSDYYVDTAILEPTAALDSEGAVLQHTNSHAEFGAVTHTGAGTGVVAVDASAFFAHSYSRSYKLVVLSALASAVTFAWYATPIEAGNNSLPSVPLVKGSAAPTFVVDLADPQSLTVELELGVRVAISDAGTFLTTDSYEFTAHGPALFENDAVISNTNQFASASDVLASAGNTGAGSLVIDADAYALEKNTNFTVQVTAVDTGVVVGSVNTGKVKFSANPTDGQALVIGNGRTGATKQIRTIEFSSDSSQSVAGSALVQTYTTVAKTASGVLVFNGTASQTPNDGDLVTITDTNGVTKVFEFDIDGSVNTPGAIRVIVSAVAGQQSAKTMANFVSAVNSAFKGSIAASDNSSATGTGKATLVQAFAGIRGNSVISVTGSNALYAVGFSGGADASDAVEQTATAFAAAINDVFPRLDLVAVVDDADATSVSVIQGSRFVFGTNPVAGETTTVGIGDNVHVFEFTTNGTVTSGHIAVAIGGTLLASMQALVEAVTALSDLDIVGHASNAGNYNTVVVASRIGRCVTLAHTGASITSVVSDAVASGALNNGAFSFYSVTGLSGAEFSGLAGGQKAGDSPDIVTLSWGTSGEMFTSGSLIVTEETANKLFVPVYGGLRLRLSQPVASYARGSITGLALPSVGDTISLNDKINALVTFTFVAAAGGAHDVVIGASVAATVSNLRAAIIKAGLAYAVSGSGASIVLAHTRSGSLYNGGITVAGSAFQIVNLVGGGNNYSVGDKFTFTALAPRKFPTALDNRTTKLTVAVVGADTTTLTDPNYMLIGYQSDTPEGGFGTVETGSAVTGHFTLPGQIGLVARNVSRFVQGDKFEVKFVNNGVLRWTLDAKTTESYAGTAIMRDRNGATTGAAGSSYLVLKNKPYTATLKVKVNGVAFYDFSITEGSGVVILKNLPDFVTKIVFAYTYAGSEPALGTSYYLSAQYIRPDSYYSVPKVFASAAAARSFLEPVTVSNDLAIAAQVAFDQSPTPQMVAIVQVRDADDDGVFSPTDIDKALAGCMGVSYISDLVPINLSGYMDKFMAYNLNACDPFTRKENLTYFGMPIGSVIGDNLSEGSIAFTATRTLQVYGNSPAHGTRVLVAPTTARKKIALSDNSVVTVTLDGSFVAAAIAARIAGQPDNSSTILHSNILGFSYVETFNDTENKLLGGASTIYFTRNGTGVYRIEEDITVDTTASHYNLLLAMKTKHDSVRMMRKFIDTSLIGYTPDTKAAGVAFVKAGILSELMNQVGKGVIAPFQDESGNIRQPLPSDVQVIQDANDPTLYHFRYLIWTRSPVKRLYGTYSVNEATLTGTL